MDQENLTGYYAIFQLEHYGNILPEYDNPFVSLPDEEELERLSTAEQNYIYEEIQER